MRLSVATNFDDRLIERIREYPVFEVYGKLPADLVGGGRASLMLGPLSGRELRRHIGTVHRHGLEFNYLLNAACLDNLELTRSGRRRIHRLLGWLATSRSTRDGRDPFVSSSRKSTSSSGGWASPRPTMCQRHTGPRCGGSITLNSPLNREFETLAEIRRARAGPRTSSSW
jgi:hypothetical protein